MKEEHKAEVERRESEGRYERRDETVNIHVDGVGVKKQKDNRNKGEAAKQETTEDKKRSSVQNIVAHIEWGGKGFTLSGKSVLQVLRFVLAVLLDNRLASHCLRCFTDGERSLKDAILTFFAWHVSMELILDWYHLPKKCKEKLSSACRGRDIRNRHAKQLIRLLWYGLVDAAIIYLHEIPQSDIKSPKAIEELVGYIERNP
jgi:hypothetical protein